MKKDFDYSQVPGNYLHCLNAQCPHAKECLRYLVTRHLDSSTSSIIVLNPARVAGEESKCPYLQPDHLTHFGKGITHLYDHIPLKQAMEIKDLVYSYCGKNLYYRLLRKERLVSPEMQDYIRQVFRKYGIKEEPVYDEYVDRYDW